LPVLASLIYALVFI